MSQVKTKDLNDVEKTSVVINYIVAAFFLYFGGMGVLKGGLSFKGMTSCPDCLFQLLVAIAFALMASAQLFEV